MRSVVSRVGARLQTVEDIDFRLVGQETSCRHAFVELGDEERAGAGGPQRGSGLLEADPIGVRFDHGSALSGRSASSERSPIIRERAEIYGQAPRRAI